MLQTTTEKKTRRPRPKQQPLPEMAEPEYPVLEEIAGELYEVQTERVAFQQKEKGLRQNLRLKMEELKLTKYRLHDGKLVELSAPDPKAYVRKGEKGADDGADVRATTVDIIEPLKADESAKTEPTTEESQSNAAAFFDKAKGKGKKAKTVEAELVEPIETITFEESPDDVLIVPEMPKDIALYAALHNAPGATERWQAFRSLGDYSATRLRNAIAHEFSGGGALETGGVKFAYKAGKAGPQFWFGKLSASGKPTLEGERLLSAVRTLMQFPAKKKATVR